MQEVGLCRYLLQKVNDDSSVSDDERQNAANWFYAAVGLALIPPAIVSDTWVQAMDDFTPDHRAAINSNDYIVSAYIDQSCSLFQVNIWNVQDAIVQNLPRINNSVEGYNSRVVVGAEGENVVEPPGVKLLFDCYTKNLKLEAYYEGSLCSTKDVIASKIVNLNNFHAKENSWQLQTNKINKTREKIKLDSKESNDFNITVGKIMFHYLIIIFLMLYNIHN
ncbi:unnamed protein product [Rotaria magnacalcarata]|uniref:Uncharacterized protein n=1 Tax=Rotaria magnacalcarata TaxID=392030 RepID=A0A816N4P0_9BILA|nr:unnamed protein product [Rotaria magnacalcarata]CAF3741801.1 unnamed protein product [Rotaria magnacalcarata]CAF3999292.1 unnamed protein product [Rotaria magnacalcarata]CAF4042808.1 unnamed protein product [Rotaria magnacalcarata]CAF4047078.1 unnamed protein product [Rotaria magnacalcarata]